MEEQSSRSRVLIVDDMRVNRMILASLLKSNGVNADLAESGTECVEMHRKNDYDLILLDHRMPEIDGVDTFLQLKEIFKETGHVVPVVCHTTEAGRDNINLYKAAGFSDVLIKPIKPQELSDVLMRYLPEGALDEAEPKEDPENKPLGVETGKLPRWLFDVAGLDLDLGIDNCETADDYMDALSVFASSASAKAEELNRLFESRDYETFTLKAHSVKSMSHLVGASSLSIQAEELEDAGKRGDYKAIDALAPTFIADYRALSEALKPLRED